MSALESTVESMQLLFTPINAPSKLSDSSKFVIILN